MKLQIKRVYEPRSPEDGFRVLVDRLWPRGLSKEKAGLDLWAKEVAPSPELRKWFNHEPEKWVEFQRRYQAELASESQVIEDFLHQIKGRDQVTLLYGAKDREHNQAVALKSYLEKNPTRK